MPGDFKEMIKEDSKRKLVRGVERPTVITSR
jgi:hypothetical protein